jgi:beta-aspartyl-dipeptidase (metallo-type)
MFIDEVTGVGEIAIADERSSDPKPHELARIAHETHVASKMGGKSGLVHIHVGNGDSRLKLLNDVINDHNVRAEWLYATHISRSDTLMLDAIDLAKNGCFLDIDTVDENLADCLQFYLDNSGWEEQLTVSSDASVTSPQNLISQIRECVLEHGFALATILPFVTTNAARALKLKDKGRIAEGMAADILVMENQILELREVISGGRRLVREGKLGFNEQFLVDSNREVVLHGRRHTNGESDGRFAPRLPQEQYIEVCKGK